jgi:hypothetical protein
MQQMFQLSGKQFICFAEATRTAGRGIEIQLADLKSCLAVGWLMSITAFASTSITGSQLCCVNSEAVDHEKCIGRVVDQCLRFFGDYRSLGEYEICRLYADARVLDLRSAPRKSRSL